MFNNTHTVNSTEINPILHTNIMSVSIMQEHIKMDRSKNRNASVIFSYSPRISPALSVHMKLHAFTLICFTRSCIKLLSYAQERKHRTRLHKIVCTAIMLNIHSNIVYSLVDYSYNAKHC